MNLSFMRNIDRRLGPPLCFLLTVWCRLRRIVGFHKRGAYASPRNVLFIKLSEIGAVICAYPLLKRIKEECRGANLFFLTFEKNREIFSLLEGVIPKKNVLTIRMDAPGVFFSDTVKAIKILRRQGVDVAFDLELFSRFSALLAYLSGAARRIGFDRYTFEGLYRGALLTHRAQYNPLLHISKSYYALSFLLKDAAKKSPEIGETVPGEAIRLPLYRPTEALISRMRDILSQAGARPGQKILLLHTGEGDLSLREWPFEHHLALVRRLLRETDFFFVFIGVKADAKIKRITGLDPARCLNLMGQTNLTELQGLFYIANALFSNDCGLVHLAALSTIRAFILFGPESPSVFAPLGERTHVLYAGLPCSPCFSALNHRASACRNNLCLKTIDPDEVACLIKESL